MAIIALALLQLAALAGVAFFAWRRIDALERKVADLREALAAQSQAAPQRRRMRSGEALHIKPVDDAPALTIVEPEPPAAAPIAQLHPADASAFASPRAAPTVTPDTARALALALLAVAPAFALFFSVPAGAIVTAGLSVSFAMMLLALRPAWSVAAWASVITAAGWTISAFALGAAQQSPIAISAGFALAGCAGLAHAHLRRAGPGLTLALISAGAALALGAQIGLISPAGASFAIIVAAGAIVGAMSLRLESVHLAAFGAVLIGLVVFSGQDSAAIWLTPVTAWAGSLFFAIAIIRAPYLGARGVAIAGTGALAPLGAVVLLHASGHGLAHPLAAAAAFLVVAFAIAGLIVLASLRRPSGVSGLKLTLWTFALPAFAALAAAITLALPAPFAATAFLAAAAGLLLLNERTPDAAWRTLAWLAAAFALCNVAVSADALLRETSAFAPALVIAAAFVAPAILAGAGAASAERANASASAALFEALALLGAVAGANLALRAAASGGAMVLTPIGFAEAGVHISIWLIAAMLIAGRASKGARAVRSTLALALGAAALLGAALSALLWLAPFWPARAANQTGLLASDALGFIAPAILFWAHWVFWRARGSELRTRLALGAGAAMIAALITHQVLQAEDGAIPSWAGAIIGAAAFALAIGINFASGVVSSRPQRTSYFEENLHRNRRRQSRRYAR